MKLPFNQRECATILAALWNWQQNPRYGEYWDLVTCNQQCDPLSDFEIDDLACDIETAVIEDHLESDELRNAAKALLAAFGGDTPEWLRPYALALERALKAQA